LAAPLLAGFLPLQARNVVSKTRTEEQANLEKASLHLTAISSASYVKLVKLNQVAISYSFSKQL
jgi:hypothetical protein